MNRSIKTLQWKDTRAERTAQHKWIDIEISRTSDKITVELEMYELQYQVPSWTSNSWRDWQNINMVKISLCCRLQAINLFLKLSKMHWITYDNKK